MLNLEGQAAAAGERNKANILDFSINCSILQGTLM